jgi:hypothetical protein
MNDHLADELLTAHLDGTLPSAERKSADAHLELCPRCRGELALAGLARDLLRALPSELRPPTDVAAAVERRLPSAPAGHPRWYRAATVAAVAATLGLVAVTVPNLGGSDDAERAATSEGIASGPAATEAGGGESVDASTASPGRSLPSLERVDRDLDAESLHDLLGATKALESAIADAGAVALASEGEDVACARSAGGTAIVPAEARPVRLIAATYDGVPARIVIFSVRRGPDTQLRAVVVALDGCRLLAADAAPASPE